MSQHQWNVDDLIQEFQDHARRTRGTHPEERHNQGRYVRMFLAYSGFDVDNVDVSLLCPADVLSFVESLVGRYRPSTIRHVSTALRGFFRFLCVVGLRNDRLHEAVPSVVRRRLVGLPRHLEGAAAEDFIAGLDRSTPCARRDRAMVLCVARLGLRATEVVRIRLEDIRWQVGELHVPSRKTRHGALLPLVRDVGEAIANYIERDRPPTTSRVVFVLHHLRVGMPATQQTVSDAVGFALRKAGVDAPIRGPNLLRHTLATRLIRSGASLKEIADLLGHRRLETTQIYAKLDVESLRDVALPWPEVTP